MENEAESHSGNGDVESQPLSEVNPNTVADTQVTLAADTTKSQRWGGEDDEPDEENLAVSINASVKKKKRKSKRKGGARKPTGFEEYYVDPPVTPAEYEEEKDVYSLSRPFSERIETAIQRYKAKRNFDSERKDLFDKYMSYGGVDSGNKMFSGGFDANAAEEKTTKEIVAMNATNYVGDDKDGEDSNYVVDFDGCLKGFLSSRLSQCFDLTTEKQIKSHVAVIRNFLNYLLHHDVCPDYKDQVYAARASCDLGEKQLWLCTQATSWMPGDFNIACSTIFGGHYQGLYIGDQDWAKGLDCHPGMSPDDARKVLKTGLAAQGDDTIIEKFKGQSTNQECRVVEVTITGLEVVEILPADPDVLALYRTIPGSKPLGKLKAKTWQNPAQSPEDLTEEEEANPAPIPTKEYELWVEDDVLSKLFVGMKFEATIRELSFGIYYFDTLIGIYCSFYDILPNERMIGWREHVWLPPREKVENGTLEMYGVEGDFDGA